MANFARAETPCRRDRQCHRAVARFELVIPGNVDGLQDGIALFPPRFALEGAAILQGDAKPSDVALQPDFLAGNAGQQRRERPAPILLLELRARITDLGIATRREVEAAQHSAERFRRNLLLLAEHVAPSRRHPGGFGETEQIGVAHRAGSVM